MAKKQAIALQTELTNDEEWDKFMERTALLVIDIYSEWSGPCAAMVPLLKKIKMESGGDNLQYGIAKCDNISYLERFRGRCEPTWMLVVEGKMLAILYGANAPVLTRTILYQLENEEAVRNGLATRITREIYEMSDEETERWEELKAVEDEEIRIETEKKQQALYDRRVEVASHVLRNLPTVGVMLVFPSAIPQVRATFEDRWEPANLANAGSEKHQITEEQLEELLFFADGYKFSELELNSLLEGTSMIYALKPHDADSYHRNIDDHVLEFVYGESKAPPGSAESPARILSEKRIISVTISEPAVKQSLAFMPSVVSISALTASTSANKSKLLKSKSQKSALRISKERVTTPSRMKMSKLALASKVSIHVEPEEEPEIDEVAGIWAPQNSFTRALAIKLFFPKLYDPIALPEPVPIPPHVAIAFDSLKRAEVYNLIKDYSDEVMRLGFFTTDNPQTAELVAKSIQTYERIRANVYNTGEKLVIQLSRKRSEPWCMFSQISPTFMSYSTKEGEQECKLFFPEGYDELEEENMVPDFSNLPIEEVQDEEELENDEEEEEGYDEEEEEEEEGEEDPDDIFAQLGMIPEG